MTKHPHNIRRITSRTICGRPVLKAVIVEENDIFQAVITDVYSVVYVSGSNARDIASERRVLREMLDPAKA